MRHVPLVPAVLLLFLTPSSRAQDLLYEAYGSQSGGQFGDAFAFLGDVDRDGVRDWIIGAPFDLVGNQSVGSATVISGRTGNQIHQVFGQQDRELFGHAVVDAGDVNLDGHADFAVGAAEYSSPSMLHNGRLVVYSGKDASILLQRVGAQSHDNFGYHVIRCGDLDGDGARDFLVSSVESTLNREGFVQVLAWQGLGVIRTWDGEATGDRFGLGLASLNDVDGDGIDDLAIGAPFTDPGGTLGTGTVYVYSGQSGAEVWRGSGTALFENLGFALDSVEDVNGDGIFDVAAGAPGALFNAGRAVLLDGASGAELQRVDGGPGAGRLGWSIAGAGDWTGDGVFELLIGAPTREHALLVDGGNGAVLYRFTTSVPGRFGTMVMGGRDVNGDGRPDVMIGAPLEIQGALVVGTARIFQGHSLLLQFDAATYSTGDVLDSWIRGGAPGALAGLFITGIKGSPAQLVVHVDVLDPLGTLQFTTIVPPGLSGLDLDFVGLAARAKGAQVSSVVPVRFL